MALSDLAKKSLNIACPQPTASTGHAVGEEIATAVDAASATLSNDTFIDVTLTAAQMLALNTTPVVLVPAPGVGKAVLVDQVYATLVFNTAAYSTAAGGASLKYKANASGQAVGIALTQGFLQSATGTNMQQVRASATAITDVTANWTNQPVVIQAATSDPTTGDSLLKIRVYYKIVPAPLA
jgi:hypothetical protein